MADSVTQCKLTECKRPSRSAGYCSGHYERNRKHGDPRHGGPLRTSRNAASDFLDMAIAFESDDCLNWPFAKYKNGYGRLSLARGTTTVSRAVCIAAHGQPDDDSLQAAHSCNNRACCNPAHIRWATAKENADDRVVHGTWVAGRMEMSAKLTHSQVIEIYERAGTGEQLRPLAREFGVGYGTVQRLTTGQTWSWLTGEAA